MIINLSGINLDGGTGGGGGGSYVLPVASPTRLGGIKVGSGLSIDNSGVLSVSGGTSEEVKTISLSAEDASDFTQEDISALTEMVEYLGEFDVHNVPAARVEINGNYYTLNALAHYYDEEEGKDVATEYYFSFCAAWAEDEGNIETFTVPVEDVGASNMTVHVSTQGGGEEYGDEQLYFNIELHPLSAATAADYGKQYNNKGFLELFDINGMSPMDNENGTLDIDYDVDGDIAHFLVALLGDSDEYKLAKYPVRVDWTVPLGNGNEHETITTYVKDIDVMPTTDNRGRMRIRIEYPGTYEGNGGYLTDAPFYYYPFAVGFSYNVEFYYEFGEDGEGGYYSDINDLTITPTAEPVVYDMAMLEEMWYAQEEGNVGDDFYRNTVNTMFYQALQGHAVNLRVYSTSSAAGYAGDNKTNMRYSYIYPLISLRRTSQSNVRLDFGSLTTGTSVDRVTVATTGITHESGGLSDYAIGNLPDSNQKNGAMRTQNSGKTATVSGYRIGFTDETAYTDWTQTIGSTDGYLAQICFGDDGEGGYAVSIPLYMDGSQFQWDWVCDGRLHEKSYNYQDSDWNYAYVASTKGNPWEWYFIVFPEGADSEEDGWGFDIQVDVNAEDFINVTPDSEYNIARPQDTYVWNGNASNGKWFSINPVFDYNAWKDTYIARGIEDDIDLDWGKVYTQMTDYVAAGKDPVIMWTNPQGQYGLRFYLHFIEEGYNNDYDCRYIKFETYYETWRFSVCFFESGDDPWEEVINNPVNVPQPHITGRVDSAGTLNDVDMDWLPDPWYNTWKTYVRFYLGEGDEYAYGNVKWLSRYKTLYTNPDSQEQEEKWYYIFSADIPIFETEYTGVWGMVQDHSETLETLSWTSGGTYESQTYPIYTGSTV